MTKLTQTSAMVTASTPLHNPRQEAQPWPVLWPVVETLTTPDPAPGPKIGLGAQATSRSSANSR
jgi:hypothetical protein